MQVIVATTKQRDLVLYRKMNIQSNIVIANQYDKFEIKKSIIDGNQVEMITTDTKGVGKNRNIGMLYATDDIILFADDDVIYKDGYRNTVCRAFSELADADVIIFRMEFMKNNEIYDVDRHLTKRVHCWNGLSFGTYQIAIRRVSILRENIHFTHLFGGGCLYSAGEDSLFLIDCFRKKLKVYTYGEIIGINVRDTSSWFHGFNEKFFYDRGAFIMCAFPKIKYFILCYFILIYRKKTQLSINNEIKFMTAGMKGYKDLLGYEDVFGGV